MGDIYVFTSPDSGVKKVSFWVDDPEMTTTPYTVEGRAPFDLAGTAPDGTAFPFDTTTLTDGSHTVTAKVEPKKAVSEVVTATFMVDNSLAALIFTPEALALSAVEGGSPVGATTSVDTNDASTGDVALTSSAPWLSGGPTAATTPADLTITADPSGLAPGTYSATVTASSPGYVDAVLAVSFNVAAPTTDFELRSSALPDRTASVALSGQDVNGDIHVFTSPDTGVKRVRFWVDDPGLTSAPFTTETAAPFDLVGTASDGGALPFDTTTIADGAHTVSALLDLADGSVASVEASFAVDNQSSQILTSPTSLAFSVQEGDGPVQGTLDVSTSDGTAASITATPGHPWLALSPTTGQTPATITVTADPSGLSSGTHTSSVTITAEGHATAVVPVAVTVLSVSATYSLQTSASSDRSSPAALDGATVAGDIHVFTTPDTNVGQVRFWIDDPTRSGEPHMVEFDGPFDLNGTATDGTAVPYDTTALSEGAHTVTALLDLTDGTVHSAVATFTVDNLAPGLSFSPNSLSFALDLDGPASAQTVDLGVDTGDSADFTLTSDATWLRGAPVSGTAPTQIAVTADPSGLTAGTYTGTLTASSSGMSDGTVSVTATVGDPGECSPLACSEILVPLPYLLTFDEDHGKILDANGTGTGFTHVDSPSKGAGYLRDNLVVDAGALAITTTAGLATGSTNSQDNAIAVGIDAPNQVTVLSTTLLDVPSGTGNYEQAGLWFGNDEDNHVKLVAQSSPTGPRVEFLMEVAGARSKAIQKQVVGLAGADVAFKLKAVPDDRTITASYSVNNGPFNTLGTVTAPGEFFSFDAAGIDPTIGTRSFGGVFASHRNGPAPLVYRFDDFGATAAVDEVEQTATNFDRVSFPVSFPTSMVWGPDDRLYVAEMFGKVHAITLDDNHQVIDDQVITTLGSRLTLGLTIDPASTANDVVLWVAHSNPSLNKGEVNSSTVTRLSGAGFGTREDVITGLPRALANHAINSIHFGPDGRLYIAHGGNTGAGAPNLANTEFGDRPEQPLSAAMLVADVKAAGFEGDCATPLYTFGVPATCDVSVFASGLRNTYDFVFHSNGSIYAPDNGLGVTGTHPPSPEPTCTGLADPNLHNPGSQPDVLNLLESGRYYGHPNPYRDECVFKDGRWQGVSAPTNYTPPVADLGNNRSANGTIEYTGDAFCGGLRNEILIANYSVGDNITRLRLSADGRSVTGASSLIGGFNDPLPLAEGPDGVIFVGEFGSGQVTALIPQDPGCWETRAPLPVKLLDAGGTALGGKLYVVGGKTGTGYQSTTHVYDPGTDAWTTAADLPGQAVENPAVTSLDGKLYAFGGSTSPFSGAVPNAAVYDPTTDAWTPLSPMPTPRGGAAAQAIGSKIHVAGGMGADGASVAAVEVYDPATDTWSTATSMTTRRDNPGSAVLDGQLYLFGGRTRNADGTTANGTLGTVESYDPVTDTWTERAPMPTGRRTMMVGTLDGRAQVMGGEIRGDGGAFDDNQEYDPTTDTWRLLTGMPTGRHGGVAGTIDGTVHVVAGGPTGGSSHSDVHEAFGFMDATTRLDVDPERVDATAPVDGEPVDTTVDVSTTDGATSPVTVTTSGQAWLTASPGNLTTPGQVTVTTDPAGLSAGTYAGSVTVTASGYPDEAVPVTLTVTDPALTASPSSVSLSAPVGGSALTADVEVATNDGGTPTAAVVSDQGWLTVEPTSLSVPGTVTVTVDPAGLAAGTYTGSMTVTAPGYPDEAVPVTLTVTDPALTASPSSVSLSAPVGGSALTADVEVATNDGGTPTAAVVSDQGWLTVEPTSLSVPGTVTVTVDPAGLAAGTYTGSMTVTAPGYPDEAVPVTLTVTDPALTASPSSVSLSAPEGGSAATADVEVATNDGGTPTAAVVSDQAWLTVEPTSPSVPGTVTVTADPTGLAAGPHSGTITVSAPDYPDLALPVSFTVEGETAYALVLSLASDRSDPVPLDGQAVSGDVYVYTSPDDDVGSVDFYVDDPTMSGTPAQHEGNAPFDLAGTNTKTGLAKPYDSTKLADGNHTVTAALHHGDGTTSVLESSFTVGNVVVDGEPDPVDEGAGGELTFGRTSTSMAVLDGGAAAAETVTLAASDLSAQDVTISSDAAWLTVEPGSGTAPLDVVLTADPTGLTEGSHTALVTATAGDTSYADTSLSVTVHVVSSLVPDQVHLAWDQDPATTLTVVWRTWDDDTASTVEFRAASSSEWQAATGTPRPSGTTGQLHEATLTGLEPATEYEYRVVGDHGTLSDVFAARTAPAADGAFDVVFVADTGIDGRTDGLTTGTAQVRDEIAALGADLVLAGGDFAYSNTDERFPTVDDAIDAWFNQMQPVASRAPVMPAYGNHEILLDERYEDWAPRFPTPSGHDDRRNYSFDVGPVHFISIVHVRDSGELGQAKLDWIADDIADAQAAGARWIIPFMHASLYTDGTNHPANLDVRAQLAPLFEAAGIPLVLSTHDQAFERSYPLVDMPAANTPTSTSLSCYQLGTDGTVWAKASPGGKLSNRNGTFSAFASDPAPAWTAVRDNTLHNYAHLAFSETGDLTVTTYGVVGDGSPPAVLDQFTYQVDACP